MKASEQLKEVLKDLHEKSFRKIDEDTTIFICREYCNLKGMRPQRPADEATVRQWASELYEYANQKPTDDEGADLQE